MYPEIPLAVRPPQFTVQQQTPLELQTGLQSLRNLMTAGQMSQLQLEQARLAVQERQAIGQVLGEELARQTAGAPTAAAPALTPPAAAPAPATITATQPLAGAAPAPLAIPGVPGTSFGGLTIPPETANLLTGGALTRPAGAPPPIPILPPAGAAPAPLVIPSVPGTALGTTITGLFTPPSGAAAAGAAPAPTAAPTTPTAAGAPGAALPATGGAPDYSSLFRRVMRVAPNTGMAWIEQFTKGQKDLLGVQDAQIGLAQKQGQRRAELAQGIIDPQTQFTNVNAAYNEGLLGTGQAAVALRNHLLSVPYDDPIFNSYIQSALKQNEWYDNKRANVRLGWDAINQADRELKAPYELATAKSEAQTKQLGAIDAQIAADGTRLAAAADESPAKRNAVYQTLSPASQSLFEGLDTRDQIMAATLNPSQSEARRQHNVTAAGELVRLGIEKQKADAEYGPGTIASLAENVWRNPDYASQVPATSRAAVVDYYQKAHPGYAFPVKVTPQAENQELAARNTIDTIAWMRNALQNPNIAKNIGPIMGRLQDLRQNIGTELGLNAQEAAQAQEFRTKMRTLLIDQAQTLAAGRLGPVLKQLQQGAPDVKMDAGLLNGALNAVEDTAQTTADNIDAQRHGGKARPRSVRGFAAVVPDAISKPLADQKPGKYQMNLGGQMSWWQKNPDGSIQSITPP